MKYQFTDEEIHNQKLKVFSENPELELIAPCKIGEGILRLSTGEKEEYAEMYRKHHAPISFFIPASGSGSRMFQFLYDFLDEPNDENRSQVERFLNSISDFAFFKEIPTEMQTVLQNQSISFEAIVTYLLGKEGLNFGQLPKGLIPFHNNKNEILNPFQEQVIHGSELGKSKISFHFTIQLAYENQIHDSIKQIKAFDTTFSEQSIESNSIAFKEEEDVLLNDENEIISRPAGHGALLSHLNHIDKEIVFIKNIDNVQHSKNKKTSLDTWQELGGIFLQFKEDALLVFSSPTKSALIELNDKYQVYSESQIEGCKTIEEIKALLNRPTRVCGMVKNQGQPGGGPFWITDQGIISKQIVEKSQISNNVDQNKILIQSTHFNPVLIAASPISLEGKKLELNEFCDDKKYFIVHKKHHGQKIRFIELPGLWNGGMAFWNTIFVEVPNATFSPVKTVLDLLDEPHID